MDSIPLVQFDIHGTNPVNTIHKEKWMLTDKTLKWYLPDGSPFFGETGLVVMYDQTGAVIRRDRDYYVEGEFQPFCNITGRSICSYIRLSDAIVANNTFVTIDYQSLGAYFVPRSNLQEWIDAMNTGTGPIPWSKIFGVPPTLPPEYHIHGIKTEITDWYDFTQFFQTLAAIRNTRDPNFNDNLTDVVNGAYLTVRDVQSYQMNTIRYHDSNYYNPHGLTAFDVKLDNVDNYRTATLADDMAGIASNLFSTPNGVISLAKTYVPNTEEVMRAGILPISYFGVDLTGPLIIAGTGWTVLTQNGITLMISGTTYTVPANTINLVAVGPFPQNKTFYLYITVEDDSPKYIVSEVALRKSSAMLRVATIVTNGTQVLTVTSEQPFMVGDLLLSYTREGGIIPVSSGFPQDTGTFGFLQQSELLP